MAIYFSEFERAQDLIGGMPELEDKFGAMIPDTVEQRALDLQAAAAGVEHSRFELDVAADLGNRAYDRAQEIGLNPTSAYHLTVNEYLAGELACDCNGDGSCRVCRAAARRLARLETEDGELLF